MEQTECTGKKPEYLLQAMYLVSSVVKRVEEKRRHGGGKDDNCGNPQTAA